MLLMVGVVAEKLSQSLEFVQLTGIPSAHDFMTLESVSYFRQKLLH